MKNNYKNEVYNVKITNLEYGFSFNTPSNFLEVGEESFKKLELKDYALLVIAGVASLAFTMTNIMQFLILLTIIIFLNKKEKNKLIK